VRLIVALIAFLLWAPPSLVGLPFAALMFAARRSLPLAGMVGAASVTLLVLSGGGPTGRLMAVTSAFIVIVTVAFVGSVLSRRGQSPRPFLNEAVWATGAALVGTALLIQVVWGASGWSVLAWQARREAGLTMRIVVEQLPQAMPLYEPVVRFVTLTWPSMLVLQTLAGLALAWQLHRRLTTAPLGAPLTRFRDFWIGDLWVWGIVAWLGVLIFPVSSALEAAGTNIGIVAGVLYVLRGAAIVATFAEVFGVSAAVLVIAGAAAAALAVPLIFVLPGLCTLGITDTWYQYRRRLAARRSYAT
jgi:hypothetical protein